jgi:hypothetical protein
MADPDRALENFLVTLRAADNDDDEEQLGRSELASLLHRQPALLDAVLKLAKRDNRVRRCLSAARYYCGLGKDMCERIDAVIQAPFPAARPGQSGKERSRR